MSTKVECPGCGNVVEVPINIENPFETSVGCWNVEQHDDGGPVVMYPTEGDDDE